MEWKLKDLTVDGKGSYGIGAPAVPYQEDKLTYLRITDINDDGSLNFSDLKSVDAEDAEKYILKENDIVFARTGNSTGRSYFYEKQHGTFVYAGFLIKFSLDPNKVNPRILKYYTHSKPYFDWVNSFDTGATRGNINAKTYGDMEIELPSRKVQDKIVSILSSLDRKIELNNKINADLEEMAQAIFKNWFVDFEPFKNGKFVDSELGMIPEGWKVGKITDIGCLITDYVSNGSFASLKQNVHLYETKEYAQFIRNTDLKTNTFSVYVDKHSYDFLSKSTLYGNEIIISNVGDVGSVHLCPKLDIPMTLGNNIIMLRPNEKEYNYFLYLWFKYFSGQGLIQGIKGGSAQPKFNKTDFKNLPLLIPSFEIIERSYWIFESMFSILSSNIKENSRLSLLRDTLLPRLMSGELEVPE